MSLATMRPCGKPLRRRANHPQMSRNAPKMSSRTAMFTTTRAEARPAGVKAPTAMPRWRDAHVARGVGARLHLRQAWSGSQRESRAPGVNTRRGGNRQIRSIRKRVCSGGSWRFGCGRVMIFLPLDFTSKDASNDGNGFGIGGLDAAKAQ